MPDLEDITYSRADTIAAFSGYYDFLVSMYMKDSQVIRPPPGGWPGIANADPALVQSLGKTDEVLALLAHVPYIRAPYNWNDDAEAAPACLFADWPNLFSNLSNPRGSTTGDDLRVATEGPEFKELAPPHVVGLAMGDRENPIIVLDTKLGIIHWEECSSPWELEMDGYGKTVDYEPDSEDDVPEEEADWRHSAPAWAIPDFFEVLKDQFRTLHWIPISPQTVRIAKNSEPLGSTGMSPMLQNIYRQHGWPDLAVYRKAECMEAVRKAMEEKYPDHACHRG